MSHLEGGRACESSEWYTDEARIGAFSAYGGDDNEDALLMNEGIDFFDWVPQRERMPWEVAVVEGVQVWGCGVAPIYPNLW